MFRIVANKLHHNCTTPAKTQMTPEASWPAADRTHESKLPAKQPTCHYRRHAATSVAVADPHRLHYIPLSLTRADLLHTQLPLRIALRPPVCLFKPAHNFKTKKTADFRLRHESTTTAGVRDVKGRPYSITERRVPEMILVLGSKPAGDGSHKPNGRLPLLSARPAVIPATLKSLRALLPILLLGEQWV